MLIVTNTSQIVKVSGEKLIERFDRIGQVERMEGFLGLEVLFTQNISEYDEVAVVTQEVRIKRKPVTEQDDAQLADTETA